MGIKKRSSQPLTMKSPAARQVVDHSGPQTGQQIIDSANLVHHRRIADLMEADDDDDDDETSVKHSKNSKRKKSRVEDILSVIKPPAPELDATNLEFVKEIWRGGKSSESVATDNTGIEEFSGEATIEEYNQCSIFVPVGISDCSSGDDVAENVHLESMVLDSMPTPVSTDEQDDAIIKPTNEEKSSQATLTQLQGEPRLPKRPHDSSDSSSSLSVGVTNSKRTCIGNTFSEQDENQSSTIQSTIQHESRPSASSFADNVENLNIAAFRFAKLNNPAFASIFCTGNASSTACSTADGSREDYTVMSNCIRAAAETVLGTSGGDGLVHRKAFVKALMEILIMCSGQSSDECGSFCVLIMYTARTICTCNSTILSSIYDHPGGITHLISLAVSPSSKSSLVEEIIKILTLLVTYSTDREPVTSFSPAPKAIPGKPQSLTPNPRNPLTTFTTSTTPTTTSTTPTATTTPTTPTNSRTGLAVAVDMVGRVRAMLAAHTGLASLLARLASSRYPSPTAVAASALRSALLPPPSPSSSPASALRLPSPSASALRSALLPSPSSASTAPSPASSPSLPLSSRSLPSRPISLHSLSSHTFS